MPNWPMQFLIAAVMIFLILGVPSFVSWFFTHVVRVQRKPHAKSVVEGFEGPCIAVWLNTSRVPLLGSSTGVTGFFKRCKKLLPGVYLLQGEEFHGGARSSDPFTVESTEHWVN